MEKRGGERARSEPNQNKHIGSHRGRIEGTASLPSTVQGRLDLSEHADIAERPRISIVMPVFNTGVILIDSVRSVLDQTLLEAEGPSAIELLVVDDHSTDAATLVALEAVAALSPIVRVLLNHRTKGAAGARNTGIFEARGSWIGFLDSDDLFYKSFLLDQTKAMAGLDEATWVAAHFHVGDDEARPRAARLAQRSPRLHALLAIEYEKGETSRLVRPVTPLLECGCIGIFTARVRRDALLAVGGFDESLQAAEDYDLWLRLATHNDLHLTPLDAGVYRMRIGSLTRSGRPMYWNEDLMLRQASRDPKFVQHRAAIRARLRAVYATYCYHFRKHRDFRNAFRYATRLLALSPFTPTSWRHVAAGLMRVT
jgi:glycosyltransferase involved in cell wall biosynthesis